MQRETAGSEQMSDDGMQSIYAMYINLFFTS